MSDTTKIEWCDSTFNPWIGCTKISTGPQGGCVHCYAAALSKRTGGPVYEAGAPRRRTTDANWRLPELWNRRGYATCPKCSWRGDWPRQNGLVVVSPHCPGCGAAKALRAARRRVFCASLADVFDNEVDAEWRSDLFRLICDTTDLDWLVLTKRIGNASSMLQEATRYQPTMRPWPWPNVWLGATVVNQAEADRDVPKLLATPAAQRFVSIEPMLGPVDLTQIAARFLIGIDVFSALEYDGDPDDDVEFGTATLDWVIAGGESGPGARPANPQWFRNLRDQCAAADVPFLFKQWGEWVSASEVAGDGAHHQFPDGATVRRVGKAHAGRTLDGVLHNCFPEARS